MAAPLVSIAIATFNSRELLPRVLESIRCQDYPKDRIEILVVDGGSTDDTRQFAIDAGCRVFDNPQTEPVNAKWLAFQLATGDYLVYLDHDEVFESNKSISIKVGLFESDEDIKGVACSGYRSPPGLSFANNYINEFGDPFSFFMYRLSKDARFFQDTMMHRYEPTRVIAEGAVYSFSGQQKLPIIELCALGGAVDVSFFREQVRPRIESKEQVPHFFSFLVSNQKKLGVTKSDSLMHYSGDSFKKLLAKILWRIRNNIFHKQVMGRSGFSGREALDGTYPLKKYLFIPYSLLVFPALLDSIFLCITRRDPRYMVHLPLAVYTSLTVILLTVAKVLGYRPQLRSYDGTAKIGSSL